LHSLLKLVETWKWITPFLSTNYHHFHHFHQLPPFPTLPIFLPKIFLQESCLAAAPLRYLL